MKTTAWMTRLALGLSLAVPAVPGGAAEGRDPILETATFAMYCYWTGEATVGQVEGVLASRIGHWGGSEIIQVDYDPSRTDIAELVTALEGRNSFYSVVVASEAEMAEKAVRAARGKITIGSGRPRFIEPKHTLRVRHPELFALDLTERQSILLNTWSYFGGAMPDVLTEDQKARLEGF